MDTIYLRELTIETIIGVCPFEQQIKQILSFDIEIKIDTKIAAASCILTDTVDYDALAKGLTHFVSEQRFQLIETVAEKSATFVLKMDPRIHFVKLSVTKPGAVSNAKAVGITIERSSPL